MAPHCPQVGVWHNVLVECPTHGRALAANTRELFYGPGVRGKRDEKKGRSEDRSLNGPRVTGSLSGETFSCGNINFLQIRASTGFWNSDTWRDGLSARLYWQRAPCLLVMPLDSGLAPGGPTWLRIYAFRHRNNELPG